MLDKGYIKTKGKKAIEAFKDRTKYRTYDEVKNLEGFGGVLADDTILIDIDDAEQSEILMNIVEEYQLDCRVYCTSRGRHFLFKNHSITRNRTHVPLAVGLTADIKLGTRSSYEVIKIDGEERFIEWDIEEGGTYQEVPKWLFPVRTAVDFLDMDAGDGRNQALFNYILTLTSNDFSVDDTRECIRILNRFVLKEPLSDDELEVILRDEAFQKPVFFCDKTFLFDRFATWLKNNENVVSISNQLHIYQDGIYQVGYKAIETAMINQIPNLKKTQRREVLEYMELIADEKAQADARYIAFRNGVLDIVTGQMQPFSPDLVITNQIPWDYNPEAYSELADDTLNKLACGDQPIRALLEECREDPEQYRIIQKLQQDLAMVEMLDPFGAISYIRKVMQYDCCLSQGETGEKEKEILDELLERCREFHSHTAFLAHIAAYRSKLEQESNRKQPEADQGNAKRNPVRIMTYHGSKGLEFDTVFLPFLNSGDVPHGRNLSTMELEEERRLFYVAVTRAKKSLYLSCEGMVQGENRQSVFWAELKDYLEPLELSSISSSNST